MSNGLTIDQLTSYDDENVDLEEIVLEIEQKTITEVEQRSRKINLLEVSKEVSKEIQGDGIEYIEGKLNVDETVVRTSGNQSIDGEKDFNDPVTFNGLTTLNTYCEDVVSDTWNTSTQEIDLSTALVHNVTITSNVTSLTFSNAPANKATSFTLILNQSSNANTVTWPASVKWADDNLQPTINIANRTFILSFMTPNGGTTWYGFLAGGDFI